MILRCPLLALSMWCQLAAAPAWQAELTPANRGSFTPVAPCALDFQVSWNGMLDSGRLHLEFAPPAAGKSGPIVVRSSAASAGLAATLFPYRSAFSAELQAGTLRPRVFRASEADLEEVVTTTTRFFDDHTESSAITVDQRSGKESRKDRQFNFSPVFDIFSAMLFVRSQKLEPGDQLALVVNPFGTPYLLRVKVLQREIHLNRNTICLTAGLQKIERKTLALRPYKKMQRPATLWLSDDDNRIPVEIRAPVFIGDVRAILTANRPL